MMMVCGCCSWKESSRESSKERVSSDDGADGLVGAEVVLLENKDIQNMREHQLASCHFNSMNLKFTALRQNFSRKSCTRGH